MTHGISEEAWIQYVDDQLSAAERRRIDAHLVECSACSEFLLRIAGVDRILEREACMFREAFPLDPDCVHVALAEVLVRALDSDAKEQALTHRAVAEHLRRLEEVLAAMCGSWTAVNALRLAAMNSIARSPEHLTQTNWPSFLENLTLIASVFCGDAGARLLWEHGQL